jgi:pyruvate dehydrogenase E2 component (dihydrolipoamide acetyltransferase)
MNVIDIAVPDIGDFSEVEVIEVLVAPGDHIGAEQSLITVESDKASMEIPSPAAGRLKELKVKVGDKVTKGSVIGTLEVDEAPAEPAAPAGAAPAPAGPTATAPQAEAAAAPSAAPAAPAAPAAARAADAGSSAVAATRRETAGPVGSAADELEVMQPAAAEAPSAARAHPVPADMRDGTVGMKPHASPSVRLFARELGVDLSRVKGTGPKGRITADDVRAFVKGVIAQAGDAAGMPAAGGAGLGLIAWPKVDFAKYGEIEVKPLSRIKKIAGANLHRNWVMIPHVTNHEDADITELEAFRQTLNAENAKRGVKLTMLAFLVKACIAALKKHPEFNTSLEGESLVYKRYYHIGFAADTPNGLMVPVIKDADKKGLFDIAAEMAELAGKARDGKLGPAEMQGGTFSISSLGGIGGTYFTPIINAPEVAILGVCRSAKRPVWNDAKGSFEPRLILPLSLSWDHRVIDGAAAARFNTYLAQLLGDFRRVIL